MEFLLQEGPANTMGYMIAGYAVIFGSMFLYLVSMILRRRNLKADLDVLREEETRS